ncbi:MAG: acyl-CoA thioesterase [Syntrophaceae bacterium]|nr:acyl-CoA thioesterase [Syntrophaceae bacterium]
MIERRVCYADTDAGGVVYYGHYLRFLEEGRTEFLRARGISLKELHDQGRLIPVIRLEIDYRASAFLDDLIQIETCVLEVTGATVTMGQKILRPADGKLLVDSKVRLTFIEPQKGPRRWPQELVQAFQQP